MYHSFSLCIFNRVFYTSSFDIFSFSFFLCFFFLQYWGLNSGPTPWVSPPALFCEGFFQDRVLRTICLGWLPTMILPPSSPFDFKHNKISNKNKTNLLSLQVLPYSLSLQLHFLLLSKQLLLIPAIYSFLPLTAQTIQVWLLAPSFH
jgi:hypothetical protein